MPPTLQDYPSAREAPPDLLRAVRAIDASATLVYMGVGRWALYSYQFHPERMATAKRQLDALYARVPAVLAANPPERRPFLRDRFTQKEAHLQRVRQGYRCVRVFTQNDPDGRIVDWFRVADWKWRNYSEAALDAELAERTGENRPERADDLLDIARAREAWRWAFKHPHSVVNAGIPKPAA